jgi:hypothetical protein
LIATLEFLPSKGPLLWSFYLLIKTNRPFEATKSQSSIATLYLLGKLAQPACLPACQAGCACKRPIHSDFLLLHFVQAASTKCKSKKRALYS